MTGADDPLEVAPGQQQALTRVVTDDVPRLLVLEVPEDLGDAEHADGDRDEVDTRQ